MPDVYALALLSWFVVCAWFVRGRRIRLEAMLIMIGSWVASIASQLFFHQLAPVTQFVLNDLLVVALFFSLVAHRPSKWIGVAIMCHGLMLVGHTVHHFSGWPAPGMYVGFLNACSYFAAGAIAGKPMVGTITDMARSYHDRGFDTAWRSVWRRGDLGRRESSAERKT